MNYQKPQVIFSVMVSQRELASLNNWLTEHSLENAGITTYEVKS